jgi:7-carboxy-7-deazaguanine synthase
MRGKNPVRPQELSDGESSLWVQSIFYTLQGEGPFVGQPAIFIRLGGCNLKCYWCDTDFESSQWKPSLSEIMQTVEQLINPRCKLAVITGGEPFRQNLAPLVVQLLQRGLKVQIETNGTLWVDLPEDKDIHIICSPKTSFVHERIRERVSAYKYVVAESDLDPEDGLPIFSTQQEGVRTRLARPGKEDRVYVMPRDSFEPEQNKRNQDAAAQSALQFGYNLTLQTHKILGLE